jgi:hypothetical protein
LKREVAASLAGFSVEYVRFETGRERIMSSNAVLLNGELRSDVFANTRVPQHGRSGFSMDRDGTPGTVFEKQRHLPLKSSVSQL